MVPKFKTIEVRPSETLGEKLKKIRGDLKLSYDDVEKATKIRKKYIKAIEENDYNTLPHDIYTRGFLKNYAKFLEVSQERVLEIYKRERGIVDNIKKAKKPESGKNLKSPRVIITPRTIIIFLTTLAALAIFGYIVFELLIFSSPPKLTIFSPQDNIVIDKSFIDINGKTDKGSEVYINGQKVDISEEGDFKINVSIGKRGVNSIKIVAKNSKNGKTTEKITNVIAEIPEVAVVSQGPEEATLEVIKFTLKIGPGTSWISVKKDGKGDFEGIMLPGTVKDFEASDSIELTAGNAGSTEVIFNGKSLGKIGSEGEVKTGLRFDKNTKTE